MKREMAARQSRKYTADASPFLCHCTINQVTRPICMRAGSVQKGSVLADVVI